jgi:hypothetical protein
MDRRCLLLSTVLVAVACGGNSPAEPTPPPAPACETNNTSSVSFGNRSAATTQTIRWDGLTVATLAPGQNSNPMTVAAGVAHQLEVLIANTNFYACVPSSPIPARCATPVYTCAFP